MKRTASKPINFALRFIVAMLLVSGLIRLGSVGAAVARSTESTTISDDAVKMCEPDEDLAGLYEIIAERTKQLDEKEQMLAERSNDIAAAEALIKKNLDRLQEAEKRLEQTIDAVDGASEDDISRLTSVYESMKPKTAADLFSQMTPDFAAGFLGRMSPKAAGEIMSGLTPEDAYAISVVLAGRNADVPTQ